jgi:nucleoid-associated protein YgaU
MMMKNRAIWVALAVIAAAAALMFFVVLPQMRGDKVAQEAAKKAQETVEQAKDAAKKTVDTTTEAAKNTVGETVADVKSGALAKMARLKADTAAATGELQALFTEGKVATSEQIGAAKAKVTAALKAATEFKAPEGVDALTGGMIAKTQEGAAKALASVQAMPTDAEGAKKAFDGMKSSLLAALDGASAAGDAAKTADAKPAEAKVGLPAFDVLRVEPDGSTVIAGSAEPNTKLEVMDGGKVISSVEVGPTGDFAAVLDNPLGVGDHQITLQATDKDGKSKVSEEIATVSVPKDKSGELLAMVTKPGEASRIMSMPEAKTETQVAANTEAKPAADAKSADAVTTPDLPAASSELVAKAPAVDAAKTTDPAAKSTDTAVQATGAETKVATAPEVQVSAVEIEGSKLFVAGNAKPNSLVRVYADDKLVAEVSTDKNGRFVADNTLPLAVGNHIIRADVLSANGSKVEFRASVPFFRPEGEQLAAVAGDPSSANKSVMTPLADGAYDKARVEASKAIGLLKDLYKDGKTPTAEELAAARSSTEIALKTLSEIRVPAEADQMAKDMAAKTSGEAAKALALLHGLPQDAAAVKQALGSIDNAVSSATAPSMQASSETVKPVAQEKATETGMADAGKTTAKESTEVAQNGNGAGAKNNADAQAADTTAAGRSRPYPARPDFRRSGPAVAECGTPQAPPPEIIFNLWPYLCGRFFRIRQDAENHRT